MILEESSGMLSMGIHMKRTNHRIRKNECKENNEKKAKIIPLRVKKITYKTYSRLHFS